MTKLAAAERFVLMLKRTLEFEDTIVQLPCLERIDLREALARRGLPVTISCALWLP